MQVEYESSPGGVPSSVAYQEEQDRDESMIEEGESFRPGQHQNGNHGSDDNEDDGDQQHQEGQGEPGEGDITTDKPVKKITKSRQSLAEKQLGTTIFPLSRVKKIIKADKELENLSSEAVFMVAVATEYFIKHFMEEGYTKARLEKRKTVNYKDMAAVVARSEEFDFLKDVIPQPMSLSEALERRKAKLSTDENPSLNETDQFNNTTLLNDDDLPPLAISTNPLFPNAIMKKPPNTHAKTAVPKSQSQAIETEEGEGEGVELPNVPIPTEKVPKSTSSSSRRQSNNHKAEPVVYSSPKIFTGKNAPSTPHGLTTRGAARRSLVGTEVDMSPINDSRKDLVANEVEPEVGVEVEVEVRGDEDEKDTAVQDERMEE